jgi:diaminopimelate epimerase
MKTLSLTKHHGLGNDFLVAFHPPTADDDVLGRWARRWCERRRGVGADGLIIGESAPEASAQMALFNADGSRAEMSGNGVRCFAQALAMRRHDTLPRAMTILTDAGVRAAELTATEDPASVLVTVDMGAVVDLDAPAGWSAVGSDPARPVAHLGVGNPHTVVGVDDVDAVDLVDLGSRLSDVNVEVIEPGPEPDAVTMRVHERGVGLTDACGTGACAAAVAASRWGLVADTAEIVVRMPGGSARVTLDRPAAGRVTLTGPATYVATIEVPIP